MTTAVSRILAGLVAVAVVSSARGVDAQVVPANRCAAAKTKCVVGNLKSTLGCHIKAERTGQPLNVTCVSTARDKFVSCVEKAETKPPCLTTGDVGALETASNIYALNNVAVILAPGFPTPVLSACSACKNKAVARASAGKLGCLAKAFTGSGSIDPACQAKVEDKFTSAFAKCETKPPCLTAGDASAMAATIGALAAEMTAALDGRWVANGDGTVTDLQTGLQWETKTNADSVPNLTNPHDADNVYTWSTTGSAADEAVFADFLATLNTPPCFAGHCDWRLPTVDRDGGTAELETILIAPDPCGIVSCAYPIFGHSIATRYWSSTTYASTTTGAWFVSFYDGFVGTQAKVLPERVRAVRTAP